MKKVILVILSSLVFIYIGIGYYLSSLILDPPPRRTIELSHSELKKGWGYDQKALQDDLPSPTAYVFESATNGIELKAWLYSGSDSVKCGLVMAHGLTENRANMFKYAHIFRDCGCDMLLFDHRGHGQSGGDQLTGSYYESKDVLAAVDFLTKTRGLKPNQIGLIGESWGAAAVLNAAAQNDELAFVLAESPFSSWSDAIEHRAVKQYGSAIKWFFPTAYAWVNFRANTKVAKASPKDYAKFIKIPTLITHSAIDTITPYSHSQLIAQNLDPKIGKLEILDWDAWHAHNALARPQEYKNLVTSYFKGHGIALCE